MKLRHKASEWLRHVAPIAAGWMSRTGRRTAVVVLSRGFVLPLLVALIALELCMMGVGVVRRLEIAAQKAQEAAREELAAIEAQAFAQAFARNAGSAAIGANTADSGEPEPNAGGDESSNTPPPLRARDVATILAQLDGDLTDDELLGADLTDGGEKAPTAEAQVASDAAVEGLSKEDAEEVDELIRKGFAAMVAGDMRRCILNLEQAKDLAPKHPAMLYYFGMAYDKLLNPDKARQYYTQVYHMRDRAGSYFARASRRLTYGFEQPSDMRGKLSFGPCHCNRSYGDEGERIDIVLPVLLAPGETVRTDDIYLNVQFFVLVNNRRIEYSRFDPTWAWQNSKPTWSDGEENLTISLVIPPLTAEEKGAYGDMAFYGFTAKIYYKDEPLDCISTPSALILHEQRLNNRRVIRRQQQLPGGLFPEDDPGADQATPFSEFLEEHGLPSS